MLLLPPLLLSPCYIVRLCCYCNSYYTYGGLLYPLPPHTAVATATAIATLVLVRALAPVQVRIRALMLIIILRNTSTNTD